MKCNFYYVKQVNQVTDVNDEGSLLRIALPCHRRKSINTAYTVINRKLLTEIDHFQLKVRR